MNHQRVSVTVTRDQAYRACASRRFADTLSGFGQFDSLENLLEASRDVWFGQLNAVDWLEAFKGHPAIGAEAGRGQHSGDLSAREQAAAAASATEETARALAVMNGRYEARFGHVFLIFASGKTSDAILDALRQRYDNPVHVELYNAAVEQQKITEKRLTDMLADEAGVSGRLAKVAGHLGGHVASESGPGAAVGASLGGRAAGGVGGITSHVLDTCHGRPASGVTIRLERCAGPAGAGGDAYTTVSTQTTNEQGRVTLVENGRQIAPGRYRVWFDVAAYYERCRRDSPDFFTAPAFFPEASVVFDVTEGQSAAWDHFHVPLTWSPFGYGTYRGS